VNNTLNVDFSLHSTFLDAFLGTNGWTFCNYNDPGIGFPRDCGPNGKVNFQWNSYTRGGGDANHHAFLLPIDKDFQSTIVYPHHPTFLGTDYAVQKGTSIASGTNTTVASFDNGNYLTYASANFGPSGSTKGIRINYSKGNTGGKVEVRLGLGTTGRLIGEFRPAKTESWINYLTAYFDIEEDVEGIQDITFVSKSSNVLNLAWFELSDFSERSEVHSRIAASEYSDQKGTEFGTSDNMNSFHPSDYITYANVNFGPAGTTDLILVEYAKGNTGGRVEVWLDGTDGTLIGEFRPNKTGGWWNWEEAKIALSADVSGIHDLTFLAKGSNTVMNMAWFELSNMSENVRD